MQIGRTLEFNFIKNPKALIFGVHFKVKTLYLNETIKTIFDMKSIFSIFSIALLMVLISSCTKCNNEDPTARVLNNGSASANLQLTASDGDIVSITELGTGLISSVKSYSPGTTTLNGTIDGVQLSETIEMSECVSYDITISSQNKIVVFSTNKNE